MPISQSHEAQQRVATRLYRDFHAMKTYGKEPESLQSIISLFTEQLAEFTYERIEAAMKEHAGESAEFPTPADIKNRIRARQQREMDANRPERRIFKAP